MFVLSDKCNCDKVIEQERARRLKKNYSVYSRSNWFFKTKFIMALVSPCDEYFVVINLE